MSSESDPIIVDFVIESREHLADVENQLLAIEAAGANIDVELVNEVFRAVHSIKGAAGFLGFTVIGRLSHEMENVLNLVRNRELVPDSRSTDALLRSADVLVSLLEDIEHSNEVDVSEHIAALGRVAVAAAAATPDDAPQAVEPTPSAPEEAETPPQAVSNALEVDQAPPQAASKAPEVQQTPPQAASRVPEVERALQPERRVEQRRVEQRREEDRRETETNIRVSVSVLDSLMNLAGELVLSRNQLLQAVGSTGGSGLDSVASRLDQVTSEIQEAIMQTRMQAVGTVFNRFPRVVRDLSSQLGKQCQLMLEGEEVELDKSVIEAIGDPLTHLVRNAVDHGIESPEERVRVGKPPVARIVLRAFHQAGKVNISISDDGGGIDVARIKERAISRGLLGADQAAEMSDREALRLIFRPGFSMAEKVSDISGRGVGMDVVKTNIEKLGGTVGIETQPGRGTTIDVKLPLTLAIIPSLIVRCRGQRFAVPQSSISELVRVKARDLATKIERVKQAEVFRLRGNLLPLVRLDSALELDANGSAAENPALHIIVVEAGHLQYGLVVDGLHDSEEIVVKPLGRHMQGCHCLAGATILGDGKVALILDVSGIAAHSRLALPDGDDVDAAKEASAEAAAESQHVLLFSNHPREQFGIPMGVISRLERVRTDQIDSVGGRDLLQYRGVSLPLLTLEKHINAAPRPDVPKVYIVLFNASGREIGLVVPELIDIREMSTDVDTVTLGEPGVIGSVVVDGKATRLLDLYELTSVARPEWFQARQEAAAAEKASSGDAPRRVLLAEDSDFFRKQVAGFLAAEGHEVVACEDGQIAWNRLQDPNEHFDLVVTDLEMPNMTGLELSSRIKDDPALAHLPVIALTSLAGEEDIQRGMECGIDDYQIKLDRERLVVSVARYLQTAVGAASSGELASAGKGRYS